MTFFWNGPFRQVAMPAHKTFVVGLEISQIGVQLSSGVDAVPISKSLSANI